MHTIRYVGIERKHNQIHRVFTHTHVNLWEEVENPFYMLVEQWMQMAEEGVMDEIPAVVKRRRC